MEPVKKSPAVENLLESVFGRTTAIRKDRCVPAPVGCGGPAERFKNAISMKEYMLSGMCQTCQDEFFDGDDSFDEDEDIS